MKPPICRARGLALPAMVVAVVVMMSCTVEQPQRTESSEDTPAQRPSTLTPIDELLLASAKVALPPPGVQPGDLPDPTSRGAGYLAQYCVPCHNLPSPLAHSATDWPRVVRRMWLRAERIDSSYTVPVPNSGERMLLLQYLIENALRVSGVSLPAGKGRDFFAETCSQCHDLPDPGQHSAEDWRAVVRRMMDRMEHMLGTTLTPDELQRVVTYLESATRAIASE